MKILLAPSESKTIFCDHKIINQNNFVFPELFEKRLSVIREFKNEFDEQIFDKQTTKAFLRYDGVAFEAIDYKNLEKDTQNYLDKNVLIFSNIFGPILGGDFVPNYKFPQGTKLTNINIEKHYKQYFSAQIDTFAGDFVVDLRAGFYDKFYEPTIKSFGFKFYKGGKIVSHWAKFYRGIIAKEMAKHNILSESELLNLQIDKLHVKNLIVSKNKTILEMNIGE